MKISLVSILVPDPVKAHVFYTEVLGFVSRMLEPEAYLAIVASNEDPDGPGILLEPNQNPIANTFQKGIYKMGLPVIIFEVANIAEEYDRLVKKGVHFKQPPTKQSWGIDAIFDDTFGNWIQISEYPPTT